MGGRSAETIGEECFAQEEAPSWIDRSSGIVADKDSRVAGIRNRCVSVFDIFSKRQKELRGELPDVYTYDQIPAQLRVQVVYIWGEALGTPAPP
jgi:hypothetical protein